MVGPGINSAELYPPMHEQSQPTHGIVSHMSDGMSGDRLWIQYNLQTGRARLLSCIAWNDPQELRKILQNGSMIPEWRSRMAAWMRRDIPVYFARFFPYGKGEHMQ